MTAGAAARPSRLGVWLHAGGLAVRLSATGLFIAMSATAVASGRSAGTQWWLRAELLVAVALAVIGWSVSHVLLWRWNRDTRALHRRLTAMRLPLSPALAAAARRLGLLEQVVEIDDDQPTAFTYGALHPRIAVSRALLEELTSEQLEAVLRHEESHLRRLDPLRRSLLAVAGATFWYVPLVRHWQSLQVMRQELEADRHALNACGCRAVAGALLAVSRGTAPDPVAAMANPALLGARIAHLEGRQAVRPPVLPRALLLRSLAGMGAVAVVTVSALGSLGCCS